MSRFQLSAEAADDIESIWRYVANDDVLAAQRLRGRLIEACRMIAKYPNVGHVRDDLADRSLRIWPVGNYLIFYLPDPKPVRVVRVIHGAREMTL